MKKTILTISFFVITASVICIGGATAAYSQETSAAKAARLINETGITHTKAAEAIWTMPFEGKAQKNITVVASVSDEMLVLFALVAEKKHVKADPEMMKKLLGLNSELDRVKIGIDKDGDIFARIDLSLRILDKQELKENIDQVAAAADEVFTVLRPYRMPAK